MLQNPEPIRGILKGSKNGADPMTTPKRRPLAISDLSSTEREFFYRFLRENEAEADEWEFEGYTSLSGKFGLYDVVNPHHPFQG